MDKSEMIARLDQYLPEKRIRHSLNVAKSAIKLAKLNDCSQEKAEIAGILHDTAKYIKLADVEGFCKKYNIYLDEMEKNSTALSHSALGAYIAMYDFGIEDQEILGAIRYHTTGRANMTKLEEVILLADLIEDERDYPGVDELRELSYKGEIDQAIAKSFDNTISLLIKKKSLIHLRTIEARNFYVKKLKEKAKLSRRELENK
ncbi:bis(5'-nucleosyl)-tetraphosphatase (symmetrical) YqeK [Peptostreptococcus equinus]|uniref:bis(5'-nucleosyl)-tetraphosphatase (symmetrical) n=1 Tax=Peptostreptococcus equinus TaxID=3003601 RepID=A0ABY7JLN8_9FIRM|nr:bis(5'-nucleosyl)-tetraphosphatase (symmetrical) YqeK [Peptostreptococcus sp. CBA3647]WAW14276.1 bis(5'-nucleosyl)-tetraphosphatase (symmetrical) YqeK [Peptostreptococcus sp. CBA3647]